MPRFVVHEHHASRLHWDFRLEMDGVLKSWAVPKGPSTEVGVKRLAVEVEDHPLDYIDFEGEIEEGYGKGQVLIWDQGTYDLDERTDSFIAFVLHGKKLEGRYKLIFTGFGGGNGWLLIKRHEEAAQGAPASRRNPKARRRASGVKKGGSQTAAAPAGRKRKR